MDSQTFRRSLYDALAACRRRVDAFLVLPAERPFAEVVQAFDRILLPLDGVEGRVQLFTHVHPEAEIRDTGEELEREIAAFRTELSLHRGLFDRLSQLDPRDAPDDEARRALEHGLRDFRRSGVDRDEATRERLRILQEDLVRVGQQFDRNIVEGGRMHVAEGGHAALDGMPRDYLDAHPEDADGMVVLSTDPGDRMAILSFAHDPELRREYFLTSMSRAVPENLAVLPELLAKRHQLATLLGYRSWADYVTEDKMTRSAAEARGFLDKVIELVRPRADAEYAELLDKERESDPEARVVGEWGRLYLTERVRESKFGFDSQDVRPYFPYARVLEGVLATSARLYGVEFRPNEDVDLWHPSVRCYDVVDKGEVVARFFLDMHARDNKYKHAAMFHVAEGLAGEILPEACLVCNFPEPRGSDHGLMLHDQVTTFFHEFGHLLHHLFGGRQGYLRFSGIATERDFVEVPSQMYEEWAWSPDVLATFARHIETDEPIPAEMVARMRAASEYGKGLHVIVQMFYATLSLTLHDRDPEGFDIMRTVLEVKQDLVPTPHEDGNYFHASFGHLNGYSAMYYTYMWSLVIAKDLFSRFDGDLMNSATANEYRLAVLARGGSKDAADLVRDFLGRDYAFEAFESWILA